MACSVLDQTVQALGSRSAQSLASHDCLVCQTARIGPSFKNGCKGGGNTAQLTPLADAACAADLAAVNKLLTSSYFPDGLANVADTSGSTALHYPVGAVPVNQIDSGQARSCTPGVYEVSRTLISHRNSLAFVAAKQKIPLCITNPLFC